MEPKKETKLQLQLVYYGNPILRKRADEVTEISSDILELIEEMTKVLDEQKGLGLAAPQVGHSIRLFLTRPPVAKDNEDEEGFDQAPLRVFINPKILSYSEEVWDHSEGCLSIPKIYGDVDRPFKISLEAMDETGRVFIEEFTGWAARVILHENDHLNGVLFIDRMDKKERKKLDVILRKIKKTYS